MKKDNIILNKTLNLEEIKKIYNENDLKNGKEYDLNSKIMNYQKISNDLFISVIKKLVKECK